MVSEKKNKSKPEIRIVFDTSVLYTKSEHYFFKKEISDLIIANNNHTDIAISWYIPEIVRHERFYQMSCKAFELLPNVKRLEKLLGHNLNITEDIVSLRVKEAIDRQFHEVKIHTIELDVAKVNWKNIIFSSAFRQPPFEAGVTEKGFRDSLVAESFLQLVAQSPVTAKTCRLVLMTDDKLMIEAVSARIKGSSNVKLLPSVEELKGLINTLVSEADETFIDAIQEKCQQYFFQKENKETLFYKEDIRKIINDKFKDQLVELPKQIDVRENGTWYIGEPQFVKKEGQRIFWATRIRVEAKAYTYVPDNQKEVGLEAPARLGLAAFALNGMAPTGRTRGLRTILGANDREKILNTEGSTVFEINWSISVTTTTKSLSKPKVEDVIFVETIWEQ